MIQKLRGIIGRPGALRGPGLHDPAAREHQRAEESHELPRRHDDAENRRRSRLSSWDAPHRFNLRGPAGPDLYRRRSHMTPQMSTMPTHRRLSIPYFDVPRVRGR